MSAESTWKFLSICYILDFGGWGKEFFGEPIFVFVILDQPMCSVRTWRCRVLKHLSYVCHISVMCVYMCAMQSVNSYKIVNEAYKEWYGNWNMSEISQFIIDCQRDLSRV